MRRLLTAQGYQKERQNIIMSLIELMHSYAWMLHTSTRAKAVNFLVDSGVHAVVIDAIMSSFNDNGQLIRADGSLFEE